jgi:hypothetical protein
MGRHVGLPAPWSEDRPAGDGGSVLRRGDGTDEDNDKDEDFYLI